YLDDSSPVPAGDARAIIRHTAAAPAVDIAFDDTVVAAGLAEPGSDTADVPAAGYQVSVWSPGTRTPLVASQPANLAEGAATVMYLIGSAQAGTLSWIAEQLPDLATPPSRIQTGDSGLAADPAPGAGTVVSVVGGVGAAAALAIVVAWTTRRRR